MTVKGRTTSRGRAAVTALAALAATAAGQAVIATPTALGASGDWMIVSCVNPDNSAAPSYGWTGSSNAGGFGSNASPSCSPGNPMTAYLSAAGGSVPVGAYEELTYTPPAGAALAGGSIAVEEWGGSTPSYNASPNAIVYSPNPSYDSTDVQSQCAIGLGCSSAGPMVVGIPANAGGTVTVQAQCGGDPAYTCNTGTQNGNYSQINVLWANLLLSDQATGPGGSNFSGSVLGTAQAPAHGDASLNFQATDGGAGVYRVTILVDGSTTYSATPDTNSGSCVSVGTDASSGSWMFDSSQPCKKSESVGLTIDTTAFKDGQHDLKVLVENAAQQTTIALDTQVVTANYTTASSTGTETHGGPTGPTGTSGGSSGGTTTTPAAPHYTFGLSAGVLKQLSKPISRPYPGSGFKLTGRLYAPGGVPVSGGAVTVTAIPIGGGGTVVARALSNALGFFTLRIPAGDSRNLRFAAGAGVFTIHELVKPVLSFKSVSVSNNRLRFSGRIAIAPGARPTLIAEGWVPGHGWQSFGQPFIASRGRFSYRYQLTFSTTQHHADRVRVIVNPSPQWLAASSPIKTVIL
jgi:hypothetical protein